MCSRSDQYVGRIRHRSVVTSRSDRGCVSVPIPSMIVRFSSPRTRTSRLSRGKPSQPQRRHHSSGSLTRHASTARPDSRRCPTAISPSSSRRVNVVRSGVVKVASGASRSFGRKASEPPSSEDLDPYPRTDAPPASSTLTNPPNNQPATTPSIAKSQITPRSRRLQTPDPLSFVKSR